MSQPISVQPVVLCGGVGSRLWPLSRSGFPKQFLVLSGNSSLFQQAVSRFNMLDCKNFQLKSTIVVTSEPHRFLVLDQLREINNVSVDLILEPKGRNTAPSLTLAALQANLNGDDPILVVSPSDQSIGNNDVFISAMQQAIHVAISGKIVIFGVKPTQPITGFGYVKCDFEMGSYGEFSISSFKEKPSVDLAEKYIESGDYFWNAGIFVVRASVWLEALNHFNSEVLGPVSQSFDMRSLETNFIRPDSTYFLNAPNISADFAVLEKCPGTKFQVNMIPLDADWNDLGSWDAVWSSQKGDLDGNVVFGDVLIEGSENNLVYSSDRLVSVLGVNDLIIIETPDAVLVAERNKSENVKNIVARLAKEGRNEETLHRKIFRPWGWFDTIDFGERFKVKRIQVKPGASLSLQKHLRRAEHWVVVKGSALVECGDTKLIFNENESTFIPVGEVHRLSNITDDFLEIIEVQSGEYLEEDDIVRIQDRYARV
jgi:mannose-1-phosphate guanylyltransferase/mannose-6-phosphate isomerase